MKKIIEIDPARLRQLKVVIFDFDGVFTDNSVVVSQDGTESVICSRFDGIGLSKLRKLGLFLYVVSTETNPVVSARCKKLKINCIQSVEDKAVCVEKLLGELNIAAEATAYVGNDVNDIPAFRIAGLPIAVADRHPDIDAFVDYIGDVAGGKGAVREVCDLIARAFEEQHF